MRNPSRLISKKVDFHIPFSPSQCLSLLQPGSLHPTTQLHALLLTSGLLLSPSATHLLSKLTSSYSLSGHLSHAHNLFAQIPQRTTFLYNTLIRAHVQSQHHLIAIHLFSQMISSGFRPDNFTFPFVFKACGDVPLFKMGLQVHCKAFVSGFLSNEVVQNCLIAMYMNCGEKEVGSVVFEGMNNRSVVSWNTMIAGLFQNGCAAEALMVFDRMVGDGVKVDEATVVSVLPACAVVKDLETGRRVHVLVDERGFGEYAPVRNSLIDMYAKCGNLGEARRLFDDGNWRKDVVSWTAMIGGCVLNGCVSEALHFGVRMQFSGIKPNLVTMASLLSACSSALFINYGKCLHGLCIRLRLKDDIVVETALIDMYANCGNMNFSARVFETCSRRTATWNAVVSGFAHNKHAITAIKHFKLMLAESVQPDQATIASVLPAYSDSADMNQALNLHCFLTKTGFLRSTETTTGLVDAYAKTGCLDAAKELFEGLNTKDYVAWSAIISGYGKHGHAKMAISLLERMIEAGIEPNKVTFTSVLYSCSHAGLVDEGVHIFQQMLQAHQVKPSLDHYACVVDLIGRAGKLEEAYGLIKRMPYEPNQAVWGALLGACVVHENVELGELAAKHLFEIEPENTGNYVLLGNVYAAVGRWEDAESVRSLLNSRGLRKAPGCSSV
ncbi:pentatricopeptide repeat-containing protein At5g39350 [Dioscorea cayenensis subsp. rotundata]|uniref:Pentatricopeptide repeat-containing protein At5g39350 n=1 Tax=Dioscorea cayennensis subsp. rotundata TaxID=55577 RepID=A0AB40CGU6_DIOCR|nr:pentatricopeptide repeat-containing protein At5g39350 [Dioscorea cayenensis subsp. rotundata]